MIWLAGPFWAGMIMLIGLHLTYLVNGSGSLDLEAVFVPLLLGGMVIWEVLPFSSSAADPPKRN